MRPSLAAAAEREHLLNPSHVAAAPSTAQTWTLFLRMTALPSLHLFLRVTALRALPYQHLLLLLLGQ